MGKEEEALIKQYAQISKKLKKIRLASPYSDDDNRKEVFGILRGLAMYLHITFNIMQAHDAYGLPPEYSEWIFGLTYQTEEEQDYWKNTFLRISKLAVTSQLNFIIENFFKTLLKEIDKTKEPPSRYYTIMKELFSTAKIKNPNRKIKVFNTLAMIRNSFHNNGVHVPTRPENNNITITINKTKFKFRKGKHNGTPLKNLGILFDKIIDYLEEIVNAPKIKKLSDPIPKLYIPS